MSGWSSRQADPQSALGLFRQAVNDKNFYWYNRYRTTDGYSTYGDRAFLKFSEGPGGYGQGRSNYGTVQREIAKYAQLSQAAMKSAKVIA